MIAELRQKYQETTGKKPWPGWTEAEIKVKLGIEDKEEISYDTTKYKELPQPLVEYLEREYGKWLEFLEIGQRWRNDYGGYGVFVRVPKEYSTEYKEERVMVYDNRTRTAARDSDGNEITSTHVMEDIRWFNLARGPEEAKDWLGRVKQYILSKGQQKGIRIPSIQ